jgi:hypothetical protein
MCKLNSSRTSKVWGYVGERQLINLFWLIQGVSNLSTYLTYLDCRKQAGYGVSSLWNHLHTSFVWPFLLINVPVGLKVLKQVQQCLLEKPDRHGWIQYQSWRP